jgi:hypothetical protein
MHLGYQEAASVESGGNFALGRSFHGGGIETVKDTTIPTDE